MFVLSKALFFVFAAFLGSTVLAAPGSGKNACKNMHTDFTEGLGDNWHEETGSSAGWKITNEGLVMSLSKPDGVVRKVDVKSGNLPYNNYVSNTSPTFVSEYLIHYGKVTFELKTAGTPGAVTAAILMAPTGGDEIDFEMLGGGTDNIQSNFFYGPVPIYNANSQSTTIGDASSAFHSYTIEWSPQKIQFYIDGTLIRSSTNQYSCQSGGECEFPVYPSAVKFGIWDASNPAGTAQWARGPIDWDSARSISATVKSVTIECNPNYNQIL
ncbi:concanavalin A-like lectin/glucanase domain-containing protein [Gilbertella persicaria]|uniref:concanavalin A-like lectin/glucanase domain-containing protein n=1 Tax=Gilbertella persicaria TaxID=101096 RepID=UPI00221F593F|nr:concanavalin A-like lectin/glucanase domain-containing protein [Gilbertella persicaria]KAI8076589.1 concanavalin A-like lectin/glucanase domain-containing protein [Gilbertella persicaria]